MQQKYDPRNESILVHVGGKLVPRREACVSVFDSSVQGGDAVWEGLRVYSGRIFMLEVHLRRLQASAHAMAFVDIPGVESIQTAIFETLRANGMRDETHIRLTLTRGEKITSGMDPRLNQSGSCLIVLAEWKPPVYESGGITLVSACTRRNSPLCVDSKIHHNNLINNILAKIEANVAGADDALMLDVDGFVAETNATNVFAVRGGELLTPFADACLPGITRAVVLDLARENGIRHREARLSLVEFYTADEVFTTGTMGELTPVLQIDGRAVRGARERPLTRQLQQLYRARVERDGVAIPG